MGILILRLIKTHLAPQRVLSSQALFQQTPWAERCCSDLPPPAAVSSDDRARHATQTLLNSSFHISSWCVQVIWSFYLLEPFFFFLKGNVLMLPIEIRGNKLLQDNNTWWVSASWGKGRPSSACDVERCLMLTSWLVPLIRCLSGAVLCLPRRGKCGNLFVTFPYAERAQRRRGSFLWAVSSLFPLICFMGVPFLSERKEKCQDCFLEKLNAIWKLNRILHTRRISMNNRVLLSQWPHSGHTQLWYLSWRHCRSQEGSLGWLKDMKPLFLGLMCL